ncbi:TonB-dependent receptor [Sphingopyxis sp. GW247-27LB]|uniref:TonB-dependent receptor n=1 Tax=Sphingopyxis sp. GW247-27LB TaxID=2012632 RepID=UPI000BA7C034|nr:TonB-dependent receptor [Sphingopyxis sp. GW247-27LB]PAL21490.1 hypothetical protein CD928_14025 [Sphingopyxis sp. GW247-27LB]
MITTRSLLGALLLTTAASPFSAVAVHAQEALNTASASDPSGVGIDDIVVTAERRETRLQETPIAVSVVGGDALQSKNITSVTDLAGELPNVNINSQAGMTTIAVRGLGLQSTRPADDPRVAFYVDEVYVPRPFAQSAALFDIERVEVARGPQGTLFGRNATGGAFSVASRAPTTSLSGYANITVGNYGLIQADGAISGPVSDTVTVRLAGQKVDRGGFGKNLFTGKDVNDFNVFSTRGTVQWEPSAIFRAKLIGYYSREDDAAYVPHIFGTVTPGALLAGQVQGSQTIIGNFRDVATDITPTNDTKLFGVTGNFELDVSDTISLKTIMAYQKSEHSSVYDTDGTTSYLNNVFLNEISDAYSAEFQVNGDFDRFKFTAGLYWFYEDEFAENRAVLNAALFGRPFQPVQGIWSFATLKTDAWAAFAQGTYDLTDRLSITAGIRYSDETRRALNDSRQSDFVRPFPPLLPIINAAGFPRNLKVGFTSVDPKVSLNYKLTDDIFAYASFTTGFKSGGFNYGSVGNPFLPENIEAYEAGLKTSWFDNRLIANFSLFRYDYTNIQTQVQFFTPVTSLVVLNAAGARNQGLEVEITAAPAQGLRLDASLSLLDAEYTEFITGDGSRPALGLLDLKGFTIPQSPDYMINLGAAYTLPVGDGDLTLRGEYRRTGRTYYTPFNLDRDSQAPHDIANAFLTYDSDRWTAGLWVRNLTDKFVKQGLSLGSGLLGGGGGYSTGSIAPPRTYGATFGVKF